MSVKSANIRSRVNKKDRRWSKISVGKEDAEIVAELWEFRKAKEKAGLTLPSTPKQHALPIPIPSQKLTQPIKILDLNQNEFMTLPGTPEKLEEPSRKSSIDLSTTSSSIEQWVQTDLETDFILEMLETTPNCISYGQAVFQEQHKITQHEPTLTTLLTSMIHLVKSKPDLTRKTAYYVIVLALFMLFIGFIFFFSG
uniref:Uncharacterized protein n=1 Tax=Acrobeloides nanus TaxID=290746 RepID=A0A914C7U4_9BILA